MSLQQQEKLKLEEVNGAEDQRGGRGAVVLGAKTECVPAGTLCACVCKCLSVCINQCVCCILPVYNYPINLRFLLGAFLQCKSNK